MALAVVAACCAGADLPRITIRHGRLMQGDEAVSPMGGNYVMKAHPWYPEPEVVAKNAQGMAADIMNMNYQPPDGRKAVPVVRLGTYFEGYMPRQPGVVDAVWMQRLSATIAAFAESGVYVILDSHQDAISATGGGAGLPWWMTAWMQENAGSVPDCPGCQASDSYITTPSHPLRICLPEPIKAALRQAGVPIPAINVVNDTDPWLAYSVGSGTGDPASMSVGNINMRANNHDEAWGTSQLHYTYQMQNVAWRFYRAHRYPTEKAHIFDHYVAFMRYLASLWEQFPNVIAIDLLNEPPWGGLPNLYWAEKCRTDLWDFYAAVFTELDTGATPVRAPFILEDVAGSSFSPVLDVIMQVVQLEDISWGAIAKVREWSSKGQLIYEFHWYPDEPTEESLQSYMQGAYAMATLLGSPPIYLAEFWTPEASTTAHWLGAAIDAGCGLATYWQFVDTGYTGTMGWFKYPDGVTEQTLTFSNASEVDWQAWDIYEQTVANGTYWGAAICGATGGKSNVLGKVPDSPVLPVGVSLVSGARLRVRRHGAQF